jgi:hypothetical protein
MTSPALFSTILFPQEGHEALPEPTNPYFVVGGRQRYIHKKMHFGNVLVPVDKIDNLPDLDPKWKAYAWFDIPPVPAVMIGQAWSFFRSIYNKNKSEAMLDLYYHREHGYRFFVPPQIASGGGVKCVRIPEHIQMGWRLVGTLHSHCDMTAYHSGTDTHDADGHDGIHFTIGHVTHNPCQIAVMASANGIKWDLKIEDVIDGEIAFTLHPKWWERYVEHQIAKDHFALQQTPKGHVSTWGGRGGAWRYDDTPYNERLYGDWPFNRPNQGHVPTLYADHQTLDTLSKRIAEKEDLDLVDAGELDFLTESIQEDIYRIDEDLRLLGIRMEVKFRYAPHLRDKPKPKLLESKTESTSDGQMTAGI